MCNSHISQKNQEQKKKLENYAEVQVSSSKEDNLVFPSEVGPLRGHWSGLHGSEVVFFSLMGNTLCRKKEKAERGQEWNHQTKGVPTGERGELIIIPASAM